MKFILGVLIGAAFLAGVPAQAQIVPKTIDFTQVLKDEDTPLDDPYACAKVQNCTVKLTLGRLCYYMLRSPDQGVAWDEALHRAELAEKLKAAKEYDLLGSDFELIKKQTAKTFGPAMVLSVQRAFAAGKGKE